MQSFKPLFVAAAFILSLTALPASGGELVVTGEATVETVPDMATITLGVETQARTAAAALDDNSRSMAELLAVLKAANVEGRDTQTRGLMLDAQYTRQTNSSPSQISGYVARNQVQVRVRNLDDLGAILDAAVRAGGNQFYGLQFDVQDKAPLNDQALADAVRAARHKAGIMAEAAGVSLGPVVDIRQSGTSRAPSPMVREMAMAMDAVPIAEGSVGITASVTVVYEIAEP